MWLPAPSEGGSPPCFSFPRFPPLVPRQRGEGLPPRWRGGLGVGFVSPLVDPLRVQIRFAPYFRGLKPTAIHASPFQGDYLAL